RRDHQLLPLTLAVLGAAAVVWVLWAPRERPGARDRGPEGRAAPGGDRAPAASGPQSPEAGGRAEAPRPARRATAPPPGPDPAPGPDSASAKGSLRPAPGDAAVEGHVFDPEGNPLAGMWVRIAPERPRGDAPLDRSARTDASGRFRLEGLSPG